MSQSRQISYITKYISIIIQKAFFGLFFSSTVYALPEDNLAVLEMSSGHAMFDQKKHCGTFTNEVALDQGSTHIRAHRIDTETDEKNQLIKALIFGEKATLAHYWTTVSKEKPTFHAYAERIEYHPSEHLIKLIGQARIQQGENSFSAATINYNTETQKVLTANALPNERALIVFHSETHDSLLEKTESTMVSSDKSKTTATKQTEKARI